MIAAFTSVWHLFMRELGGTLGVNSARCNHSAEERDPGIAGVAPHNRPYPDSLSLSLSPSQLTANGTRTTIDLEGSFLVSRLVTKDERH